MSNSRFVLDSQPIYYQRTIPSTVHTKRVSILSIEFGVPHRLKLLLLVFPEVIEGTSQLYVPINTKSQLITS
jgi:hypothetical protein